MRDYQTIQGLILEQRGISLSQREQFLHPNFARDTYDPNLMAGMDTAIARLKTAVQRIWRGEKESIGIFGDYDADGVPATALLYRALKRWQIPVKTFIPTRSEGYGLTMAAVERIREAGITVLICVDNGTVSVEEIATLAQSGIDVIVIDHHHPDEERFPRAALAVINPKQATCAYQEKELCASALAWKVMTALYRALPALAVQEGREVVSEEQLKWDLDLVAISTVADMVPLLGENRVLAMYGMRVLAKTRSVGLKALAAVSGVNLQEVTASDIGFKIAPRLNAPSRMHAEVVAGEEHAALALLTTEDPAEADRLAHYLNEQNSIRQSLVERHIREAEELIASVDLSTQYGLVVYHPDWSSGVIGLVAGRLLEKYGRPVLVLASEDGEVKGSLRSVEGVHAVELLNGVKDHLKRYGGHAKAAGLTVKGGPDTVPVLSGAIQTWIQSKSLSLLDLKMASRRVPDLELSLSEVNLNLATAIAELEPFGIGFPTPLFSTICTLTSIRKVGREEQHLSCFLEQEGVTRKSIGFHLADTKITAGQRYRVFYTVNEEEWRGVKSLVCQIKRIEELS
jgi:single-stranded-DNA-specific exonuclease